MLKSIFIGKSQSYILYPLALISSIDLLFFYGGRNTIFIKFLPWFFNIEILILMIFIISIIFKLTDMVSDKKWKNFISLVLWIMGFIFLWVIILIPLQKKSKSEAFNTINVLLSNNKKNYVIDCEESTKKDFQIFLSNSDPSNIQLLYSYPHLKKYIFLVRSNKIKKPFIINLLKTNKETKFLIYNQGVDNLIKDLGNKGSQSMK